MTTRGNAQRIVIFCAHAYPYRGGLEKNVLEMASRLAGRGLDMTICCFNSEGVVEKETIRGVKFVRLPAVKFLGGTYTLPVMGPKFWRMLSELAGVGSDNTTCRPTAVLTQTRFFFSTFIGYLFARRYKIRFVHTERGTSFVHHKNPLVTAIAWLVDQTWSRFLFTHAETMTGVSERAVEFAKSLGSRNGKVIHNGIEAHNDAFRDAARFTRRDEGNPLVVAFAGRVVIGKGVRELVDAVSRFTPDDRHFVVRVYGNGSYLDPMKADVAAADLDDSFDFRGEVDSEVLRNELRDVDIFINPSYTEGLPTSVLEAAEAGCAVIATDVGGTHEIIDHEISGLIIEPRDVDGLAHALQMLVRDSVLRDSYGEEAQRSVRAVFSWDRVIGSYQSLFNESPNTINTPEERTNE